MPTIELPSVEDTLRLGESLSSRFSAGDVVLLYGNLGAGKTTLVRGYLTGLGFEGSVKSPTFNLIQVYGTSPPVMHADLYRLASVEGVGLEDYVETHVCFIEWPERLGQFINQDECWQIHLTTSGEGRSAEIREPLSG